jgi:hypothetical protein
MLQRRRRSGRRSVDGGIYRFQYAVHICGEIIVPKAQNAISGSFKPTGPYVVASTIVIITVVRAIHLDNQSGGHAGKVGNVRSDRDLTPKVRASHRKPAQLLPHRSSAVVVFARNRLAVLRRDGLIVEPLFVI